jgi:hypothetical protein
LRQSTAARDKESMRLDLSGHPIHTRTLSVTFTQAEPPAITFKAYVLDLRKRGFVPVGGDLQGTGIIHHMLVEGTIDAGSRRIETITATMPTVAFEASEASGFESCRDLVGRVDHLAQTPLDESYARRVGAEIGGPRGCSHILTLVHLIGPTASWAIDEDRRLHGDAPSRRIRERIFRRDVTVDGLETQGGELELALQMNDLHLAPSAPLAPASSRFAGQLEIRALARAGLLDLTIARLDLAERRRGPANFETAEWVSRAETVAPLRGLSLRAGITSALYRHFPEPGDDRPLLDALLMLAPTTVQCFAALADTWTKLYGGRAGAAQETGGLPDSCYMWRREGALGKKRAAGSF